MKSLTESKYCQTESNALNLI